MTVVGAITDIMERAVITQSHCMATSSEYTPGVSEWNWYVNILKKAKEHPSGYMVFLTEPQKGTPNLDEVSTINYLIHVATTFSYGKSHYPTQDSENKL